MKRHILVTLILAISLLLPICAAASEAQSGAAAIVPEPTPIPSVSVSDDSPIQLALAEDGALSMLAADATQWDVLATGVLAATAGEDARVFYLQKMGLGARVMEHDPGSVADIRIEFFGEPLHPTLAVYGDLIYLMSETGDIYALPSSGAEGASVIAHVPDAVMPRLLIEDGFLRAYSHETTPEIVWSHQVAPIYTPLKRGDRGDEVKRLQEALRLLGYPAGYADGIFGAGTEEALRYFQFDAKLPETGQADEALQALLYDGDPPAYQDYVELSRGDRGIRVRDLQDRLRELYYSKEPVDGIYGSETGEAVKRFQEEKGYRRHASVITAKQVSALFHKHAPECSTYYELSRDDDAPIVLHLNKRLKKLGYLSGSAGSLYTKHTAQAVRDFQEMEGLRANGIANERTQELLFAKNAPTPEPTPEPTPPPPGKQVVGTTAIKRLRTFLKNNMGLDYDKSEAVSYLQDALIAFGYLSSGQKNGVYNYDTKEAIKAFQAANGMKADGIVNKATMQAMFLPQ